MSLYLITGIAGTGKTTTINTLNEHGCTAYDIDEGFAEWVHTDTGERPGEVSSECRDPEFQKNHDWKIIGNKVAELHERAKSEIIFLGGIADGLEEYYPLFSKMFFLEISKEELVNRLKSRRGNDFGKSQQRLESSLRWHGPSQDLARAAGMVFIDAEQPVEKIVTTLLAQINN